MPSINYQLVDSMIELYNIMIEAELIQLRNPIYVMENGTYQCEFNQLVMTSFNPSYVGRLGYDAAMDD